MNTLTNLIPALYSAMDIVSREWTGFIPSVARDSTAERAAVGQPVRFHKSRAANVEDVSPAMTIPEPTDKTIGNDFMEITKARTAEFGFVGEEQRGLNAGPGYRSAQADEIAQAMRSLTNEVELDLAGAAAAGASRAAGAAGTTPFATNLDALYAGHKILADNGAPQSDLALVVNSSAGAKIRTLYGINADRDFSEAPLDRQGVLASPEGIALRQTGQPVNHTAGTASGATTNAAGYAAGATVITLASAGTGTILAGDVITFAGDDEKYVVASGDADVSDGGTITLQEPGLREAIPAEATAITVGDAYASNVIFHRRAIQLVTRAPALPEEGDAAIDRMMITDPRSGLVYEVSVYGGYRKVRYDIALAWGWKAVKPAHIALVQG